MAASLDPMYHTRFKVKEDGARDVACIVGLIEEDVFAVATLSGIWLQVAIRINAVLLAELLPELGADWDKVSVEVAVGQMRG